MQKTAYEMRISDWSSYVCSSDLLAGAAGLRADLDFDQSCRRRLYPGAHQDREDQLGGRAGARCAATQAGEVEELQPRLHADAGEIGRASCRERVCQYV